jgi:DNA-directed RNA polymerase subunit M/transcription elongation factor TFIIS
LSTASDTAVATSLLSDPKLERLLTIGKEINDLLFKISAANEYLAKGNDAEDFDAVEMARKQLARDLSKEFAEAKVLLRTVDEAIGKLAEHKREEENVLKMYVGLSRIEGLEPTEKRSSIEDRAASTRTKIVEIDNLIKALDALQVDLGTARLRAHFCPRCSSHRISYRISPSELGYSIYKCDQCGNAWKITQFSVRAA